MSVVKPTGEGGEGAEGESVAELVHRRLEHLTPGERKVARTLLARYPMAGLEPLSGFAQRAEVSHPTILRCIAKLGYAGYAEFQAALRGELEARLKSPLSKHHAPAPKGARGEAGDGLSRFAEKACANIRQSLAGLSRREVEAVAGLLADRGNTVHLLGGRFTDAIALYTYMHLRVLRPRVLHVSGPPLSWSEYLLDMNRRAVLLVFDIRRYQDDVIAFAEEAAGRGARVVLITDQWLSPIAGVAEHVLAMRIEVPSAWDSSAALLTLMEAVIARLNERIWPQLEGRIADLERLRTRFENHSAAAKDRPSRT